MFVAPGDFAHTISRDAAPRVARNRWMFLLNGLLLIVAGVLVVSIDWRRRSLAIWIGALCILEGLAGALTSGIDVRVRRANVITGLRGDIEEQVTTMLVENARRYFEEEA